MPKESGDYYDLHILLEQLLMSFDGKGGRKKNKKNLTKKRHRKNT